MSDFSLLPGEISPFIIETSIGSFDMTSFLTSVEISESIFSPFVSGMALFEDTESFRMIKNIKLQSDLSCKVNFSFAGLEDDGKTPQKPIKISPTDYFIYKVDVGSPRGLGNQTIRVYFAHRTFLLNQNSNLSKSYKKMKISEMVSDLAQKIEVKWNEIEETKENFCFVLPYRTAAEQIMFMTPYARRQENNNDNNFVFFQDLSGKHSFVSIAKLMTNPPTFGNDANSGFAYGFNVAEDFKSSRRAVITHATKTLNEYENAKNGMHSSAVMTMDPISKIWAVTTMFLPQMWKKQTHLSTQPLVEQNSNFYDFVNGAFTTRYYEKSRHSHCCKEQQNGNNKIGGPQDWLLPRISQIEQLNQTGVEFFVTGFSDTNRVGAGKVVYFGRPLLNNAFNSSDGPDVTFSGKYLVSKVTHSIKRAKSGKIEYGCNIIGIKDSLGEE
jgi:hypothetical protein